MLKLDATEIKVIEAIYSSFLIDRLLDHGISIDDALLISREYFQAMRDY